MNKEEEEEQFEIDKNIIKNSLKSLDLFDWKQKMVKTGIQQQHINAEQQFKKMNRDQKASHLEHMFNKKYSTKQDIFNEIKNKRECDKSTAKIELTNQEQQRKNMKILKELQLKMELLVIKDNEKMMH